MEIRLGTIESTSEGETITFLKEIDEKEFQAIDAEIQNVERYNNNNELHMVFIINFIEFLQYFQDVLDEMLKNHNRMLEENRDQFQLIYRNSNRLFLNLLSSGRTLLDHTETYIKRKYGKDSTEVKTFKEEISKIYDTIPEYRFVYKLRNYAQHCGMPINSISSEHKNNIDEDKITHTIKLNPYFERSSLLSDYQEWGIVKKYIEKQSEKFMVMPIVYEYYNCIEKINEILKNIEKESLRKSIYEIEKIISLFENQSNDVKYCVFYDFKYEIPDSYEKCTFSIITIPKNLILSIKEEFDFK